MPDHQDGPKRLKLNPEMNREPIRLVQDQCDLRSQNSAPRVHHFGQWDDMQRGKGRQTENQDGNAGYKLMEENQQTIWKI